MSSVFPDLVNYCNWNWPDRVCSLLEDSGLDITESDGICIRLAIQRNSPEILTLLLQHLNRLDSDYELQLSKIYHIIDYYIDYSEITPIIMGILFQYVPTVAVTLCNDMLYAVFECDHISFCNINNIHNTLLHFSCKCGKIDSVLALIDRGADIQSTDNNNNTPLHIASQHNNVDIIFALIDRGADTYSKNNNGFTPLHTASQHGKVGAVLALLDAGANISSEDNDGCTPLHIAISHNYEDVSSALICRCADIHSLNRYNKTPIDYCDEFYLRRLYLCFSTFYRQINLYY